MDRLLRATINTWHGLRYAVQSEAAFRQELVVLAIAVPLAFLVATDAWKRFLLYVFIPHKYAAWGIITMNMLQHDGADIERQRADRHHRPERYRHCRDHPGRAEGCRGCFHGV